MAGKGKRAAPNESPETMLALYRTMALIRAFEDQIRNLHLSGHAPGLVHLYTGQEAVGAGVCSLLLPGDWIASHHRGHGHAIAKGARLDRLAAEIMGRVDGYSLGRGGSMHIHDPETRNLGTTGIVGGGIPLALGAAFSAKRQGEGDIAVAFFGDGALNQGILFETLNLASIRALPLLLVCENNGYGEFTETDTVTAGHPYTKRADAFDVPTTRADGMDVLAVRSTVAEAVSRARSGGGPSFLLFDTYRYSGHHVGDAGSYRDSQSDAEWRARDPLRRLAAALGTVLDDSAERLAAIDKAVRQEAVAAVKKARAAASPGKEALFEHLYERTDSGNHG